MGNCSSNKQDEPSAAAEGTEKKEGEAAEEVIPEGTFDPNKIQAEKPIDKPVGLFGKGNNELLDRDL